MSAVATRAGAFPKERRLRRRADFLRVQNSDLRVTTKHFVFLFSANADASANARVGIVATKRVGNAVVRNRIKRLVREAFRSLPERFFPAGVDLVVIGRAGTEALRAEHVKDEWRSVERILQKRATAAVTGLAGPGEKGTKKA